MFIKISGNFIDYSHLDKLLDKLIVCLTGMPGAGKSTIAEGLKTKGYEVFNMGNVVRLEAKNRNLEPTRTNLGNLMIDLRKKNGPGAIAELIIPQIVSSSANVVIIDGIRSNEEIDVLRKYGILKILAIHASTQTRFSFLQKRGRSDDPKTQENFEERDTHELGVGISTPIALSDETISNNNLTKDELINQSFKIIERWIE